MVPRPKNNIFEFSRISVADVLTPNHHKQRTPYTSNDRKLD